MHVALSRGPLQRLFKLIPSELKLVLPKPWVSLGFQYQYLRKSLKKKLSEATSPYSLSSWHVTLFGELLQILLVLSPLNQNLPHLNNLRRAKTYPIQG